MSEMSTFWIPIYTLVRKEVRRIVFLWIQTLLPPLITMGLYFLVFGHVIGERIVGWDQVSYGQFIAPGIIMLAMLTNTYANASSSFYIEKFQSSTEELLVSSMCPSAIVLGFVLSSMFRGLLIGLGVFLIAYLITDLHIAHVGLTFALMLLATAIMAHVGLLNALYAKRFDDINLIPTFVLTPLIYLGGVFYPIDRLSGIWQTISWYNPLVYLIEGFRDTVLGIDTLPIGSVFVVAVSMTVCLCLLCIYLVRHLKGVRL